MTLRLPLAIAAIAAFYALPASARMATQLPLAAMPSDTFQQAQYGPLRTGGRVRSLSGVKTKQPQGRALGRTVIRKKTLF